MSKRVRRRHRVTAVSLIVAALTFGLIPAGAQGDENVDSTITIQGGGWGHGVGMSQYGAYGRADAGHTHAEILAFYYPGTDLTSVEMPNVRVHLHSGSGTVLTPVDAPAGDDADDIEILDADGNLVFNHRNGRALTVRKVPGGFTVTRPHQAGTRNLCIDDQQVDRCRTTRLRFRFAQGSPTRADVINQVSVGTTGKRYQWGEFVISERPAAPDSTLYVVLAKLPMVKYVYGLAEVPLSWPAETLKTQAIAGRTYAYDRTTARRAPGSTWTRPWDLYSTVDDQVYHGYENEVGPYAADWAAAVDQTAGRILRYQGGPVTTFYSSSNGGWTEDSGYVFVTSLPYLPAQPDEFDDFQNPYGTWSRDYTGSEVGQWMATYRGMAVGVVTDVTITGDIGASGRVDRATVTLTGTTGSGSLSGNSFRNAVNGGVSAQGGGLSRQILSTKYEVFTQGGEDPIGEIDFARRNGDRVTIRGWVFDPDTGDSVDVDIRVDGVTVATVAASGSRYDVDAVFNEGDARGFETVVEVGPGAHQVCVYADNHGPGEHLLLGCKVA